MILKYTDIHDTMQQELLSLEEMLRLSSRVDRWVAINNSLYQGNIPNTNIRITLEMEKTIANPAYTHYSIRTIATHAQDSGYVTLGYDLQPKSHSDRSLIENLFKKVEAYHQKLKKEDNDVLKESSLKSIRDILRQT